MNANGSGVGKLTNYVPLSFASSLAPAWSPVP